ncbi:MAG: YuiA family protein [Bacillus sp. (in: firmicutes)]
MFVMKQTEKGYCEYCFGKGYFQLLLGGTETCGSCGGKGLAADGK